MSGIDWNEISSKSQGGTELMCRRIEESIPEDILKEFQIIPSRVRTLDETKIRILYCHDLAGDPEADHLKDGGWSKFHRIVFVSYTQRNEFMNHYDIPASKCVVLKNAIMPIKLNKRPGGKIRLIYHTTPHRGLEILVPVFETLAELHDDIELDVYSSFKIYGWSQRDEQYKDLFERIKKHPRMKYHSSVSNDEIRKQLELADIFAFPSIWKETSCLALIEAMSAKCYCVHSDLAALPETSANLTYMYPYTENVHKHANVFFHTLDEVIKIARDQEDKERLELQKVYTDLFYNWEIRKTQWEALLKSLLIENPNRAIESPKKMFTYKV